jgi:hypothetical protein
MPEPFHVAVHVAAFAQGKHLVDRDAREPLRALLQRVDHRNRLAVAEPDDEVSPFTEVVEHVLRRATLRGERDRYARRPARGQVLHISLPSPPDDLRRTCYWIGACREGEADTDSWRPAGVRNFGVDRFTPGG